MNTIKRNSSIRNSLVMGIIIGPIIAFLLMFAFYPSYLGVLFRSDARFQPKGWIIVLIAGIYFLSMVLLLGKAEKIISKYYFQPEIKNQVLGRLMLWMFLAVGNIPILLIFLGPAFILISALPIGVVNLY
jgi:hypothetical protein